MDAKPLLLLSVLALTCACKQDSRCGFGSEPGPWALKVTWAACTDERPRAVECDRSQSGFKCKCLVGGAGTQGNAGEVVSTFVLPSLAELSGRADATRTANELCGWSLEP